MSASSRWNISEADFPRHGSPRQKLAFALKYSALAPAESDWQPWHFRMEDNYLELLTKHKPELDEVDPDRRELTIGCGAALLYLKLALKHFGCLGRVDLFPDLGNPALAARVHHGYSGERDSQEKLLFEAMSGSRSIGSIPGGTSIPETMLAELSRAVAGERGWLDFVQSETSRQQVLKVTVAVDPWWQNFERSGSRPTSALVAEHTSHRPRPIFAAGGRNLDSRYAAADSVHPPSTPVATLAVVKTKTDDKHGWLAAGQTMARTVLQAQALGMSWAFFNPVRQREARAALRIGVGHKGFAQVILRFGSILSGEFVRLPAPVTATATYR